MTPLARRITKELTLPLKRRRFVDDSGLLKRMDDIHCFDCTDVYDLSQQMIRDLYVKHTEASRNSHFAEMNDRSAFLPAPKTWIEYGLSGGFRLGALLIENKARTSATVRLAAEGCGRFFSFSGDMVIPLINSHERDVTHTNVDASDKFQDVARITLYFMLAFINTPRIIGRRQHMPHRGFERDLVRAMKMVGKFPLHAWTEIKLEVAAPKDMRDDPSNEAHLTGQRALHFCRAHLRIRLGKLEIVRSHWRGDASLGIKQSRYRLAMPNAAIKS